MIFLDSPSTTPLDDAVLEAMLPFMRSTAQVCHFLRQSERSASGTAVVTARESVADLMDCRPSEIVWTSGATEANNLAILGFASGFEKPMRIVSQVTEHSAVLEPLKHLQKCGWQIELLPVDTSGRISAEQLRDALDDRTVLVSIMWGNNEVGTIQPVREIAEICATRGIAMHCDAAQAAGKVPVELSCIPISMLTISAHKFYGPSGIGALYVRDLSKYKRLCPLAYGGGQEYGLRPGTLNVAAIVGFGEAARRAKQQMGQWAEWTRGLRDRFEGQLVEMICDISINGEADNRLPHISNIAFHGADSDGILTLLPEVVASTGSACHFADFHPSHVLTALQKTPDVAECSVRFGFVKDNSDSEIDSAVEMIREAVTRLRSESSC